MLLRYQLDSDEADVESEQPGSSEDALPLPSSIEQERGILESLREQAQAIVDAGPGPKENALLAGLAAAFEGTASLGGPRKALIFTESRRTQSYLQRVLRSNGYEGRTVLFNGTNDSAEQTAIYERWLEVNAGSDRVTGSPLIDRKTAMVDAFRDDATIMIATEAASEGMNMQFCNILVNYDLPWNPQRIEQRIGRVHRYGQRFDVIVVNLLNRGNSAESRIYTLLAQKFRLFDSVFGVSDEVIAQVSGVGIEQRIRQILQQCRTEQQIEDAFDQLSVELEAETTAAMEDASRGILENFD